MTGDTSAFLTLKDSRLEDERAVGRRRYWCGIYFGGLSLLLLLVTAGARPELAGLALLYFVSLVIGGLALACANLVAGRLARPVNGDTAKRIKWVQRTRAAGVVAEVLCMMGGLVATLWFLSAMWVISTSGGAA